MHKYRKLLGALLPLVVFGLTTAGVSLPPGWTEAVVAVLTPIMVWGFANET